MASRDARMVALGYGKFVRADRIFALVPLDAEERGDGRRTYVHVEGLSEPVVASRSERAIMADVEAALAEAAGVPRRRGRGPAPGQGELPLRASRPKGASAPLQPPSAAHPPNRS